MERHVRDCADCASMASQQAQALTQVALSLVPVTPSPGLWDKIQQGLQAQPRFERWAARTARMLDITLSASRDLLERIDQPEAWVAGPSDAVKLFHISGGPRVANAIAGFVRVQAGETFPVHTHGGDEYVLVLQGTLRDDGTNDGGGVNGGLVYHAGDESHMTANSRHSVTAAGKDDLIYLVVIMGDVEIGGHWIRAGDPRA